MPYAPEQTRTQSTQSPGQSFYETLDALYEAGDLQAVEAWLLDREAELSAQYPLESSELIGICNEIGSFYRNTSRYDRSLAAFQDAQHYTAEQLGTNCIQYATILNNMAGTYRLTQRYEEAIRLFLEARTIYLDNQAADSYPYASVLNNLSLAYRETGQYAEAITYLQEALALVKRMPDCTSDVAITYNNLAALYHAAGDRAQAKECVAHAIEAFESEPEQLSVHYAAGLNSLAGILYSEQQYAEALELYRKSAEYTRQHFGENIEYGITHRNMYWVYEQMGQHQNAIDALTVTLENFTKLLGPDHERTQAVADDLRRVREAMR